MFALALLLVIENVMPLINRYCKKCFNSKSLFIISLADLSGDKNSRKSNFHPAVPDHHDLADQYSNKHSKNGDSDAGKNPVRDIFLSKSAAKKRVPDAIVVGAGKNVLTCVLWMFSVNSRDLLRFL